MISAIALDDEPLALRLLQAFSRQVDSISLQHVFTSPQDALAFGEQHAYDLIFLDIQMPRISGIDFARKLPPHVMVIFTTAFEQYAVEGFNLKAIDYLLKPFAFDRFVQAVERARQFHSSAVAQQGKEEIYVKAENGIIKVQLDRIRYLENVANYVRIYLTGNRYVLVRVSIREMEEKLKHKGFIRVHRSYIVPLSKVLSVKGRLLCLEQVTLPIGVNYVKEVQRVFTDRLE